MSSLNSLSSLANMFSNSSPATNVFASAASALPKGGATNVLTSITGFVKDNSGVINAGINAVNTATNSNIPNVNQGNYGNPYAPTKEDNSMLYLILGAGALLLLTRK